MFSKTQSYRTGPMRQLLCFLLILCLIAIPNQAYALMAPPDNLKAHTAFITIDAYSGKILMGENYDKRIYPASTTKLMTAMVMLDEIKKNDSISQSTVVTVKQSVLDRVDKGLANYGLKAGQKYTINMLFHMMLMSSYGDATYVLAKKIFGSYDACIKAMNNKVSAMGLSDTHFDNIVGLDIGSGYNNIYSTAHDMVKIVKRAMGYTIVSTIAKKATYTIKQSDGTKGKVIESSNHLYSTVSYDHNLYTVIGTKTGTTSAAGFVFAGTAEDSLGHRIINFYVGNADREDRFTDTKKIFDKIFKEVRDDNLLLRTKNSYPVIYKGNGSTSGSTTYQYHSYDTYKDLRKNGFRKTGHTFVEWNTKSDGSGISYKSGQSVTNLISKSSHQRTLYAIWRLSNYRITYHLDGGKNSPDNPERYTIKDTVNFKAPTKDGYAFAGWYSDEALTKPVTSIEKGSTGKLDLYAAWTQGQYTVKFMGNGGKTSEGYTSYRQTFKFNQEMRLAANRFQREGYTFKYFTSKSDGSGIIYNDKALVKNLTNTIDATVKLYANYKPITYHISYVLNGGSNHDDNPTAYTIEDSIKLLAPAKKGASFAGWYLDKKLTKPISEIPSGSTGDLILYASWADK